MTLLMKTEPTLIEIQPKTRELFEKADREIAERLGSSPGAEFLMSLMVENEEDPHDLADLYCFTVLRELAPAN